MSFYHIKIDYFDSKLKVNQTIYSYDIKDREFVEKKVRAYLGKKQFIIEGTIIDSSDVRGFKVYNSEYDINKCIVIGDEKLRFATLWYTKVSIFEREDLLKDITREIFEKESSELEKAESTSEKSASSSLNSSKKIFIVHGHNSAIRTEVELMVKNLGYTPIVLFKQPDGGATIIEKLEREVEDIAFSIILYTACDKGCAKESQDLRPRARQNVVFEHGMMCGILGRKRVVALLEKGLEIPGDLSGIIYKEIDPYGKWKQDIVGEMRYAGLNVDANLL